MGSGKIAINNNHVKLRSLIEKEVKKISCSGWSFLNIESNVDELITHINNNYDEGDLRVTNITHNGNTIEVSFFDYSGYENVTSSHDAIKNAITNIYSTLSAKYEEIRINFARVNDDVENNVKGNGKSKRQSNNKLPSTVMKINVIKVKDSHSFTIGSSYNYKDVNFVTKSSYRGIANKLPIDVKRGLASSKDDWTALVEETIIVWNALTN